MLIVAGTFESILDGVAGIKSETTLQTESKAEMTVDSFVRYQRPMIFEGSSKCIWTNLILCATATVNMCKVWSESKYIFLRILLIPSENWSSLIVMDIATLS